MAKKNFNFNIINKGENVRELILNVEDSLCDAIKWLAKQNLNDGEDVHIWFNNGYREFYEGTYYPEYKGADKCFNAHGMSDIVSLGGFRFKTVQPIRDV